MSAYEMMEIVNSTKLGAGLAESQFRKQRGSAGYRFASDKDQKRNNFFKYFAWLFDNRHGNKKVVRKAPKTYADKKEESRLRNAEISAAGRDIGEIPEVVNPERRKKCKKDFQSFCEEYFPDLFFMGWSDDHLKILNYFNQSVLKGGLFALACPRGNGKSTLAETACIWALLYAHRSFVVLIGSDEDHACNMLDSIKAEFENNERLAEDFPTMIYPVQKLEGISLRAKGQTHNGKRTRIGWTAKELILPTIKGCKASGGLIKVRGLTGRIRGMKYKREDGKAVRPDLVVLDDPQTDDSARSLSQCATREGIVAGAVLGLAGPGEKISGIMPCTVIKAGDMVDRILDRTIHPEWNGVKTKMVYSFPKNEKLWDEYAEIMADSYRERNNISLATEFYIANREAMDKGSVVAWEERFNEDEVSAIQHAMNLKFKNEVAFWSEYQNEPLPEDLGEEQQLEADEVARKLNNIKQNQIPLGCEYITMFIDVHGDLLYHTVVAWTDDFTGYVVDYNVSPEQNRRYFRKSDARPSMATIHKDKGLEGAIFATLNDLCNDYLSRIYSRDDGAGMKIQRVMIDANWGTSTDVIYQFCKQSEHAEKITPSHGRYVGAGSASFNEYKKKRGDRIGHNWRVPGIAGKRMVRHCVYDTNFWKSFVASRFLTALGDSGCLSLFGNDPYKHQLFADHMATEFRVKTEGRGRTVDEWKVKPGLTENHWFDCIVGCAVGASMLGASVPNAGYNGYAEAPKETISLAGMKRRAYSG